MAVLNKVFLVLCSLFLFSTTLRGQDIFVFPEIDPNLSPFIYEWENININSINFVVENNTTSELEVVFHAELYNSAGDLIAFSQSNEVFPTLIFPGFNVYPMAEVIPFSAVDVDEELLAGSMETAQLPEDGYTLCVNLLQPENFQPITEPQCSDFIIQSFQDPMNIFPPDGQIVSYENVTELLFQWTPVVPLPDFGEIYEVNIYEVIPGQEIQEAVITNVPILSETIYNQNQILWPIEILPPDDNAIYVWTVEAQNEFGQTYTLPNGTSLPTSFEVSSSSSSTECLGCFVEAIEVVADGESIQNETILVGQELAFYALAEVNCSDLSMPAYVEAYYEVVHVDTLGNATEFTLAESEVFSPQEPGTYQINYVAESYCGTNPVPCVCDGNTSTTLEVADEGSTDQPSDGETTTTSCSCNSCMINNLIVKTVPSGSPSSYIWWGGFYSFEPEISSDCPAVCEPDITYSITAVFTPVDGDPYSMPDSFGPDDVIQFNQLGSVTFTVNASVNCDGVSCSCTASFTRNVSYITPEGTTETEVDSIPGYEDTRPPVESIPKDSIPEIPKVPEEKDPPHTYDDACNMIVKSTLTAQDIDLGVILDKPELFLYPRAVPLRAEGVDWDYTKLVCSGCSGKESFKLIPTRDQMDWNKYEWRIVSGPGSLNSPFDLDKIDSTKAEIDDILKQIEELEKRNIEIDERLNGGIAADSAKFSGQLTEAKNAKTRLDSLIELKQFEIDSVQLEIDKDSLKLIEYNQELTKRSDSITYLSEQLDQTRELLKNPPSDLEKTLREQLEIAREELDEKQEEAEELEDEILENSSAMGELIIEKDSLLQLSIISYNSAKNGAEALAMDIQSIEATLMSDPLSRDFVLRTRKWNRDLKSLSTFYSTETGALTFQSLKEDNYTKALELVGSNPEQEDRASLYSNYLSSHQSLNSNMLTVCSAYSEDELENCNTALSNALLAHARLDSTLSEFVLSEVVVDTVLIKQIAQLKDQIIGLESNIVSKKSEVEQKSLDLLDAQNNYVETLEEYEDVKVDLAEELEELIADVDELSLAYEQESKRRKIVFENSRDSLYAVAKSYENRILVNSLQSQFFVDSIGLTTVAKEQKEGVLQGLDKEMDKLKEELSYITNNIKYLKEKLKALQEEEEKIKKEKEENLKKIEELEKKLEDLRKLLEQLLTPSKDAKGPQVYYIPPPLEEVMKIKGTYPQFEEKVKLYEEAKDSVQMALANKELVQTKIVNEVHQGANAMMGFKDADDQLDDLESKKAELELQKAGLQGELTLDYQDNQSKLQGILESAQNKLDTAQMFHEEAEQRLEQLANDLELKKNELQGLQQELTGLQEELDDSRAQLSFQETQLANSQATVKQRSNDLAEKKKQHRELVIAQGRARHNITRAEALDEPAAIEAAIGELNNVESQLTNVETSISTLESQLASARTSNDANTQAHKTAQETFNSAEKSFMDKKKEVEQVKQDIIEINNKLEEAHSSAGYWKMVEEKAQKLIDKTNKAREEYQEEVASAVNSDERIEGLTEEIEDVKKAIKNFKNQKKKLRKSLNENIENKEEIEKQAEEQLTRAEELLEQRETDLTNFLVDEFNSVTLEVKIELKGDDMNVDGWRADDKAPDPLIRDLKYISSRLPQFDSKEAGGGLPEQKEFSVCFPDIIWRVNGNSDKSKPWIDQYEPRTIALMYEDGKKLWEQWPVFPDDAPKLIAKDVALMKVVFPPDNDIGIYNCSTNSPYCKSTPPIPEPIRDLGKYDWVPIHGQMINEDKNHRYGQWSPKKNDSPRIEEEQKVKTNFEGIQIVPDARVEDEKEFIVTTGLLLEVTDSIVGVPDTTLPVQARVVTGDHKGLQGETIEFSVSLKEGESENWGFEGDTLIEVETDDLGYAIADFEFGDGYASYDFKVKWKRGQNILDEDDFEGIAPLKVNFNRISTGAPEYAWNEALKLVLAGNEVSETTLTGLVAAFADCTEGSDSCAAVIRGVSGILDNNRDYVNEQLLKFTSDLSGSTCNPEQDSTAHMGIAWTLLEGVGEDQELKLKAELEEKYLAVGRPGEDEKKYSTTKVEKFKIGKEGELFIVVLDEPASKDDLISGTGVLGVVEGGFAAGVMPVLKQVKLNINDVEIIEEGDDYIAKAGVVSWVSENGLTTEIRGFSFTLDSLTLRVDIGAGLGGKVDHSSLNSPIGFSAELSPNGDFLGNINNLPELEVMDFKLREGTNITLDMHSSAGPDIEDNFKGIVLHQAQLELPETFQSSEDGQKTTLHAKDLYIGSAGIGGAVAITGDLLKIGFYGYRLETDSIGIEFKNSDLEGFGIQGALVLPSPMEGKINTLIKYEGETFVGMLSTENPVSIPRLETTIGITEGLISWNTEKDYGELRLSGTMSAKEVEPVTISNFVLTSTGEIKADYIAINKTLEFGSGFKIYVDTLSFAATEAEYFMQLSGGFKFDLIGIDQLSGFVRIDPGPAFSAQLRQATIKIEEGPLDLEGKLAYNGQEFRGEFDISIKKILENGIQGLFIVGSKELNEDESYTYWYVEMTIGTAIAIPNTGCSILKMGGGVGYNYSPPQGSTEGNPVYYPNLADRFAFKAIIGLGNFPKGKLFATDLALTYESTKISLYGKLWVLDSPDNIFGEGLLVLQWDPEFALYGNVRMYIGLPDSKGELVKFDGKVVFNFTNNTDNNYIKSERIEGSVFNTLTAKASFSFDKVQSKIDGEIRLAIEEEFDIAVATIKADIDVKATGTASYTTSTESFYLKTTFSGHYDVDAHNSLLGTANLLNGSCNIEFTLNSTPTQFSIEGKLEGNGNVFGFDVNLDEDIIYTHTFS